MKKARVLWGLIALIVFVSCQQKKSLNEVLVEDLLNRLMEAHGGIESWDNVSYLSYTKEIQLFMEDGQLEKQVTQLHTQDFTAGLTQMSWEENGMTYQASRSRNGLVLTENGKPITDSLRLEGTQRSLDGAHYVFWQPRKLLDEAALIQLGGDRTLFNGVEVFELKVVYPEEENGDVWYYFIDKESHRLAATGVVHQDRISLIVNEETESETGLYLNKIRKSYFTDKDFNPLYLRASYNYQVDEFRTKGTAAESPAMGSVEPSDKQRGAHVFRLRDTSGLAQVEALNVEWVTLVPWGFQKVVSSGKITHHYGDEKEQQRRDSAWISRIGQIRQKGFKVFLKPHVWLDQTENGEWRQHIYPENSEEWALWKSDYRNFVLRYARIAESAGAEMFCVGTEFSRLSLEHAHYWRALIRDIRQVYSGKLTYAANWHKEYEELSFWSELDYIGVQAYFPLVKKEEPSSAEVAAGWSKYLPELRAVSERYKKPLLFTEMGYRSVPNAAVRPWEWIEDTGYTGLYSPETQANSYRAFFETVWPEEWFAGVHLWQLRADYTDPQSADLDFTPQFKPAAREITYGFMRKEETACASL